MCVCVRVCVRAHARACRGETGYRGSASAMAVLSNRSYARPDKASMLCNIRLNSIMKAICACTLRLCAWCMCVDVRRPYLEIR